jgi:hypothetical protein
VRNKEQGTSVTTVVDLGDTATPHSPGPRQTPCQWYAFICEWNYFIYERGSEAFLTNELLIRFEVLAAVTIKNVFRDIKT